MKTLSYLLLSLLPFLGQPLSILILHPVYAGSHVLTLQALASKLLEEGHHVTTLRYKDAHGLKLPRHSNHTQYLRALDNSDGHLPYLSQETEAAFDLPQEMLWGEGLNAFQILKAMDAWKVMDDFCQHLLGDQELFEELSSSSFDLAIVDLVYNECGLALAHKLGLPSIGYWAFSFANMQQDFTTAPAPPSYVPGFMSKLSDQMTLQERCFNFALKMFSLTMMTYHDWYMTSLIKDHVDLRSSALLENLSGLFINTDYVIDYPRPMPPTFINIGGLQIAKDAQKMPKFMREFMDGAENGVILFSMGFIFNPKVVPSERLQTILGAFSDLPYRVIFKFGESNLTEISVPDNVLMVDWVPQQAVLAHPKCKLFLTHCGMHGVLESIYHAVPMVGMPVFIDQGDVLVRMEEKGIGQGIDKFSTRGEIVAAVREVTENPSYKKNVMRLSRTLKSRPKTPMEDALTLLKYVVATEGADHLKIKSNRLNFAQFYCLDCIFVFLSVILMTLSLPYIIRTRIKLK